MVLVRPPVVADHDDIGPNALDVSVVVIGRESAGKSQLIASLTNRPARVSNFRGTTVHCETYQGLGRTFVDTPGILRASDTETTRIALGRVSRADTVLLVIQATHIDDDLAELLPLVKGKKGIVVVTFWDKVRTRKGALDVVQRFNGASTLPFVPVDARHLGSTDRDRIAAVLDDAHPFPAEPLPVRAGWRIEPRRTWLEYRVIGALLAAVLFVTPAVAAVWGANSFAAAVEPYVQAWVQAGVAALGGPRTLLSDVLVGRYGLLTMGPLLFVWAVPTAVLYALMLGAYKASGLLDRLTTALHPLMRPVGLTGRDLVRVMMGFGCNVPAVISTRACSSCSRGLCISTIAFGSACSYQMGATLGVFAAAQQSSLVIPYLLYLTVTSLIYARLSAPPLARSRANLLVIDGHAFLSWPTPRAIWRESRTTLSHFFGRAIPIFAAITIVASVLDWFGVIGAMAAGLGPLMNAFRLPAEAALPLVMASIRKDGILLFAEPGTLQALTPGRLLTGVYLAGVLLPCMVTALTIAREQSVQFVGKLLARQFVAAVAFSIVLAWGTGLFGW